MEGKNLRSTTRDFGITKGTIQDTNRNEKMEDDTRMLTSQEATQALLSVSTLQPMALTPTFALESNTTSSSSFVAVFCLDRSITLDPNNYFYIVTKERFMGYSIADNYTYIPTLSLDQMPSKDNHVDRLSLDSIMDRSIRDVSLMLEDICAIELMNSGVGEDHIADGSSLLDLVFEMDLEQFDIFFHHQLLLLHMIGTNDGIDYIVGFVMVFLYI